MNVVCPFQNTIVGLDLASLVLPVILVLYDVQSLSSFLLFLHFHYVQVSLSLRLCLFNFLLSRQCLTVDFDLHLVNSWSVTTAQVLQYDLQKNTLSIHC